MKNALLYCVDENRDCQEKMVNSINSFAFHNKNIVEDMKVYVITTDDELVLDGRLNPMVDFEIVKDLSFDYSTIKFNDMHGGQSSKYMRWEMFNNPIFNDLDNLLYLDCDTEIQASIEELFKAQEKPCVMVVEDMKNWLKEQGYGSSYYFNSGFMLITPKLMGEDRLRSIFNKFVARANRRQMSFGEQDAMNYVGWMDPEFKSLIVPMGVEYDWWKSRNVPKAPKIIHHVGNEEYPKKFIKKVKIKKNALLYVVDGNAECQKKMVNSINSFYAYNPKMMSTSKVFVITTASSVDLTGLSSDKIDVDVIYDIYGKYDFATKSNRPLAAWLKFEMFRNPVICQTTNLLYVDVDTEFFGKMDSLFKKGRKSAVVHMVPEIENRLNPKYGAMNERYYNSGMLFYTPALLGRDMRRSLFSFLLDTASSRDDWANGEQDVLNFALANEPYQSLVQPLDFKSNLCAHTFAGGDVPKDVLMVHFSGNRPYKFLFIK